MTDNEPEVYDVDKNGNTHRVTEKEAELIRNKVRNAKDKIRIREDQERMARQRRYERGPGWYDPAAAAYWRR